MDMAIGVIIGAAFGAIVTSLTENFINPLIVLVTGGNPEEGLVGGVFTINGVAFNYGAFLSAVINFLIMAFILFLLLKAMNKAMSIGKKPVEAEVTTKTCPYCQSEISIKAVKCPHCTSTLEE